MDSSWNAAAEALRKEVSQQVDTQVDGGEWPSKMPTVKNTKRTLFGRVAWYVLDTLGCKQLPGTRSDVTNADFAAGFEVSPVALSGFKGAVSRELAAMLEEGKVRARRVATRNAVRQRCARESRRRPTKPAR